MLTPLDESVVASLFIAIVVALLSLLVISPTPSGQCGKVPPASRRSVPVTPQSRPAPSPSSPLSLPRRHCRPSNRVSSRNCQSWRRSCRYHSSPRLHQQRQHFNRIEYSRAAVTVPPQRRPAGRRQHRGVPAMGCPAIMDGDPASSPILKPTLNLGVFLARFLAWIPPLVLPLLHVLVKLGAAMATVLIVAAAS